MEFSDAPIHITAPSNAKDQLLALRNALKMRVNPGTQLIMFKLMETFELLTLWCIKH